MKPYYIFKNYVIKLHINKKQFKYGSTSFCDVQSTGRHTNGHRDTDRKVKTEGPKILSNDISYFKTVIIGGPIIGISNYPYIQCASLSTLL